VGARRQHERTHEHSRRAGDRLASHFFIVLLDKRPLSPRALIVADLLAGTCNARAGNLTAARARLAHAQSLLKPNLPPEHWWAKALEGEIAMVEGRYSDAALRFAEGEPARKMTFTRGGAAGEQIYSFLANQLILRDGRARAAAAQGNLTEAIALYRELLTFGPNSKFIAMPDPLHALALARLLDKAGQHDAARVEYRRFLDWWKDADKELPQLAEARAQVK
jgi:tetratricopeptide (TPR) repeat protein